MVKLIATDLDGTFLGPDAVVSERSIRAVERAIDAGIVVVAATGRGWRSASAVLEPVPKISHAICSNGALHFDRTTSEVVRTHPLDLDELRRVLDIVVGALEGVGLGWEFADGTFGWDDAFLSRHPRLAELRGHERMPSVPLDDPPSEFLKVLVYAPGLGELGLYERLRPILPTTVEVTSSGIEFLEITGEGVHKAKGLQALCDDLGIEPIDVVAFGDNLNDITMLEWAGTSYAMANGVAEALRIADAHAPHHADDGFAQVVESLLD